LVQLVSGPGLSRLGGTRGADSELEVAQRIELPAHAVALTSQGRDLAVLAVEGFEPARARLRLELYRQGSEGRRVLRFDDPVPAPGDAGTAAGSLAPFAPE